MSKLITLDEAIEWGKSGELCDLMTEDDQRQIAEWLRHARGAESAARWYTAKLRDAHRTIRKLLNENAKLRELVTETYPYAKAFLQQGVMLGCNDTMSYDWFLQLRELGIEVEA